MGQSVVQPSNFYALCTKLAKNIYPSSRKLDLSVNLNEDWSDSQTSSIPPNLDVIGEYWGLVGRFGIAKRMKGEIMSR